MSTLAQHVENYLQLRRALGFKLVSEGVLLAEFVRYAERAERSTVTTEFALEWARRPANASHNYVSRRLRAVRSFARYLHALDPPARSRR
jgi:integrase/recombinase XerD